MALFSSRSDGYDLHRDIEALRREVPARSRSASRRGAAAWRGASGEAAGLYDDVAERIGHALPVIRRRAHDLEETIRSCWQTHLASPVEVEEKGREYWD